MHPLPPHELRHIDGGFLLNPYVTMVWLLEDVLGVDLPYDQQGPTGD